MEPEWHKSWCTQYDIVGQQPKITYIGSPWVKISQKYTDGGGATFLTHIVYQLIARTALIYCWNT